MEKYYYKTLCCILMSFQFWHLSFGLTGNKKSQTLPGKSYFERIIKIYGEKHTQMDFKKTTYIALLNKTKKAKGRIFLSNGKMAVHINDEMGTQIIFDGRGLWYLTKSHAGKKKKEKLDLKNNQEQSLVSVLFNSRRFFKVFKFVRTQPKGRRFVFSFVPRERQDMESLLIKVEGEKILQATIKWKTLNNEEEYTFSDIQRRKNIPGKYFNTGSL